MAAESTKIITPTTRVLNFRSYFTLGGFIFFIGLWSVLFWIYEPRQFVEQIGVQNGYILTFLIATIGSLTSITTVSIYPMLLAMAIGDLGLLPLALIAGAGLALGDVVFYYLGMQCQPLVSPAMNSRLQKFLLWIEKKPRWLASITIYFYIGFTPFPNNLLTGSLALAGYPFRTVIIPLFLGDMTLPLFIVYFAHLGISLF